MKYWNFFYHIVFILGMKNVPLMSMYRTRPLFLNLIIFSWFITLLYSCLLTQRTRTLDWRFYQANRRATSKYIRFLLWPFFGFFLTTSLTDVYIRLITKSVKVEDSSRFCFHATLIRKSYFVKIWSLFTRLI